MRVPRNAIKTSFERYFRTSYIDFLKPVEYAKLGIKPYEYSHENIDFVMGYLLVDGVSKDDIAALFLKHSKLCNCDRLTWEKVLTYLKDCGISPKNIIKMLTDCPQILLRDVNKMEEIFSCLRSHGFADRKLHNLIVKIPSLLILDSKFISEQIAFLMTLFTRSDILTLALKCPNVLVDDTDHIEEKVQYIVHEIGVDQKQILSSYVLLHDLAYVKLRHQLFLRTGFYKKPHPKKTNKNPTLSFIVDTSTGDLIKHIGLSLEEYRIFEKLFNVELEKDEDSSEDSSSDSEDIDN